MSQSKQASADTKKPQADGWDLEFLDLVGKSKGNTPSKNSHRPPNSIPEQAKFEKLSEQLLTKQLKLKQHHIPLLALLFFSLLIVWASLSEIDQVTRAQGKVIPTHNLQLVQSLEGGIVSDILVREGDIVTAGQKLVQLRDTQFSANYRETLAKRELILGRMARLLAEANGLATPDFDPSLSQEIKDTELRLFETRLANYNARKENLEQLLDLANRSHRMLERGETSVTKVELINAQTTVVQLRGELQTLLTSTKRDALENHDAYRVELAVLNESINRDKDRLDRTVLRSPMNGVVKEVHVDAQGQVVSSGESVIEVVPLDDSLLVQANVRPEDIGFVHSDQQAMVKFTAYDFIRYGGMEGTVEYIGADTITNESGETYYPIRIRTKSNTMGTKDGRDLSIIPGMVTDVDLLAGKKTVLQYLLTPINRAREKALKER